MEQLQEFMCRLRGIDTIHRQILGGYRADLLAANDRAVLSLIEGNLEAVWQYADRVWTAYAVLELHQACTHCVRLSNGIRYGTLPTRRPTAA
ncbi:MAG: hypothetical protein AAB402_02120 [Patescibacteria group bacterium]